MPPILFPLTENILLPNFREQQKIEILAGTEICFRRCNHILDSSWRENLASPSYNCFCISELEEKFNYICSYVHIYVLIVQQESCLHP